MFRKHLVALSICLWSLTAFSTVSFAETTELIPLGDSIEVKMELNHPIFTHDILLKNGQWIRNGDEWVELNGTTIQSKKQAQKMSKENQLSDFRLTVVSSREKRQLTVSSSELEQLLSFVNDALDGIGTLTFENPATNEFGALGHPIDGQKSMSSRAKGFIYLNSISAVRKSKSGQPGYKIADFTETTHQIGQIERNNLYGIFGQLQPSYTTDEQAIPLKPLQNVHVGKAMMWTAIQGQKVEKFSIQIESVQQDEIQFRVTDEQLLKKTGGIVQGMSGSPVIQDGFFIGVVTHMIVEHPEKGKALSIYKMLPK